MRHAALVLAAASIAVAGPAPAQTPGDLMTFAAHEACGIGPATLGRARAAGIDTVALTAMAQAALVAGQAERSGAWIVLDAEICTISPPPFEGPLEVDAPEVLAALSAPDAYAASGFDGCYLAFDGLLTALPWTRGWDVETAGSAYLSMLAGGIVDGTVRFYGTDPLATPPAFRFLAAPGCDIEQDRDAMARDHSVLLGAMDGMIRASGRLTDCAADARPFGYPFGYSDRLRAEGASNEHAGLEFLIITLAAGWTEGGSFQELGTFRPPFCTYP